MLMLVLVFLFQFHVNAHEISISDNSFQPVAAHKVDTLRIVKMTFDNPHQDLGVIRRGDKRKLDFNFVNEGNEAIKIEHVSACECTTLDWPRKSVEPGQKGTIKAIFDSTEKEVSETIEIDIYLENTDPETDQSILEIISYKYEFEQ